MPILFLAPTAEEARRAAWQWLRGESANSVTSAAPLREFLDTLVPPEQRRNPDAAMEAA